MLFLPLGIVFFIALLLILALVFALVQIGIIAFVFEKVGIAPQYMFLLLLASLLGSYINIPLKRFVEERVAEGGVVDFFGFRYVIPQTRYKQESLIAVNAGGALVPLAVSIYLLTARNQIGRTILATVIIALVVNRLARPIRGLGIAVPALVAPVLAALIAMILAPTNPVSIAYVSGSMGTLIGADLLNLSKIRGLGAPVASIGGAGTFDGIFLTGIVAVLLAGL